MVNFSHIFKAETLKNIFIYYTDLVSLKGDISEDTIQLNKACSKCGEKKAGQCGKKKSDDLLKECKDFEKFLEKEDEKENK